MLVFKFGGASVNSAVAVRNVAEIVRNCPDKDLVVVVSAMGKTTNLLERLVPGVSNASEREHLLAQFKDYHQEIIRDLFSEGDDALSSRVEAIFAAVERQSSCTARSYAFDYDQIVSFGELLSTTIVSAYLNKAGVRNEWVDVRDLIITNQHYRDGVVDWQQSMERICARNWSGVTLTQGFIAGDGKGNTVTLGREGSDYSAAIIAFALEANEVTVWKDVPGFLNADPKFFSGTVKIEQMPYNEAIELAYYGACVIHPKTIKPLQNKNIPLRIRSFVSPEAEGSMVGPFMRLVPTVPLYIVRGDQVLLSIVPKDFSFIAEENLQVLFGHFAKAGVRINLMQNSALSFSVCVDNNPQLLNGLFALLQADFSVRYNEHLQLVTIRYYNEEVISNVLAGRRALLEQRSRTTAQFLIEGGSGGNIQ